MEQVKIILPGEKPLSWNKFFGRSHWSKRYTENNRIALAVRAFMDWNGVAEFDRCVDIEVRAYFADNRVRLDSSNIVAKPYEDALIGLYITDDTPQYVRSMKTTSLLDRENPRVEIIITEVRDA